MSEEIVEEIVEEVPEEVVEEVNETPVEEEVIIETVVTAENGKNVTMSVGTGKSVFSGNCGSCGAYNCCSVVTEGKFKCTTCKVEVSA